MLYYFQSNVILLSVKYYITFFSQKLYYFSPKVPLLPFGNTSTFDQKYLYFSEEVEEYPKGSAIISWKWANYIPYEVQWFLVQSGGTSEAASRQ